ncbi:aminoglycoside phosphotransferase family protein [Actinomycetospora lemnae]|uniref:Aminoglycoside phosphotransferase family protein n=1 Tax=Actinomycetospora lemnae TaxID=3019891 RepID=A0ABT5T024_9PSEU|nr:aminoglycoside phosphotransferase family protein [Actinomycetospora sp. DW7H6]MDD7968470.1 aminoglycoside phosphotransferase family protein [Actinomycetospora sp. DW7H6]
MQERGTPGWRDEVLAWIADVTGSHPTGEVTQRHRAWSTVLRVPTADGPVWLKEPVAGMAAEVGLHALLARVAPDAVATPLAVDVERHRLLLPDTGPSVRDDGTDPSAALTAALPRYADLQRRLVPHLDAMAALGVPDATPPALPARYAEAVATIGGPDRAAEVAAWADELAGTVPSSVDHQDLHIGNVLADGRFADWGDAVLAHPFASLLVALGSVRRLLAVDTTDPALTRPRDAYLEVFTDLAPHRELVRLTRTACRAAVVARALTWTRGASADPRFAHAPAETLAALGDPDWLAGT